MSVVILNESGSKVSTEKERILLWGAVLFSKKIHLDGILGIPLDFDKFFNLANENHKIKTTSTLFPTLANPFKNPRLKDNESHFDRNYSRIKALRKKRKNKDELLELIRRESVLKKHFELAQDFFKMVRETNGINGLPKYTGLDENDLVRVHYFMKHQSSELNLEHTIKPLTDSMLEDFDFHFFNEAIEYLVDDSKDGFPYYKAYKFIELPNVTELKESQIFTYIDKIDGVKKSIQESLTKTQEIIKEYSYDSDNELRLAEIINENVLKDKEAIQNSISDCVYELTDYKKDDKQNVLYVCVSSYKNVIDIYKHLSIFKDEYIASYVKENVSQEIGLDKARMFLYLKTE